MDKIEMYTIAMHAIINDTTLNEEKCIEAIRAFLRERNLEVWCKNFKEEKA